MALFSRLPIGGKKTITPKFITKSTSSKISGVNIEPGVYMLEVYHNNYHSSEPYYYHITSCLYRFETDGTTITNLGYNLIDDYQSGGHSYAMSSDFANGSYNSDVFEMSNGLFKYTRGTRTSTYETNVNFIRLIKVC